MVENSVADGVRLQVLAHEIGKRSPIAIQVCVGFFNRYDPGHHQFVITNERNERLAEYPTLDEALAHPEAQPWGSSTMCAACKALGDEVMATYKTAQEYLDATTWNALAT